MYTKQGPLFDALTAAGFSQMQVSALRDIFAFCQHDLEQRGQLAILGQRPSGATDGMLEVANYPFPPTSEYSSPDSNGNMTNGWAINVLAGGIKNIGPFVGGFRWGKASGNWTNVAGDNSYVNVVVASDRTGTAAEPYTTVRVYLPRYGTAFDPAVYTNGVIKFEYDPNGVAVGKDYPLSTQVGERKCVDSASNIPTGWQLADGTNGTLDMRDAYIGGYKSGGTFGTIDGGYGNSGPTITISGNGSTVNTEDATADVTGNTAADTTHHHALTLTSQNVQSGSGATVVGQVQGASNGPIVTDDTSHDHGADGTLAAAAHHHAITTNTLAATLSVATAGLPHTVAPVWIERVT